MGGRLRALDGLRGVAAVVVLLSHVVYMSVPALGIAMAQGDPAPPGLAHLAANTPLAVVWAGSEFVIVFFVLSAFVLTRAALRAGEAWRPGAYYAARLVRLYLPVWAAVAFALLLAALVARPVAVALPNLTLAGYARPIGLETVCHALTLAGPVEPQLDSVLWSLHWEVVFSLLLPVLLLVAPALRRQAPLLAAGALLAVSASWHPGAVTMLAPFAVGVALALREDAIAGLRGRRIAGLLAPAGALLLTADLWLPGADRGVGVGGALVIAGAALLVVAPLVDPRAERALCRAPVQWLGRRSYSLYLVHQPIVISLAFGIGAPPIWVLLPLALGASLAVTAAFFAAVERPAQRAARAAGRAVAARRRAPAAEPVAQPA
jgi:peptidoglycan/LPS O-acetylase OafA/YrhL